MNNITGSILVVDDSIVARESLRFALEANNHLVTKAGDGQEALNLLRTRPFDLVLLDVQMPEMDGFQVLEAMKADDNLAQLPVLMISADEHLESTIRCIQLGAVDYLNKPFNQALLTARVNACLQQKRVYDQEKAHRQELEAVYQIARDANRTKDEFVALVAHELRSPISTLWVYKDLIKRLGPLNEKQADLLQNMELGLERMRILISDLDDVTRIESGNLHLEFERVGVHRIVDIVIESLRHQINEKQHHIQINIPADLPPVWGDQARLIQILTNLISNAVKYTPPDGNINIIGHISHSNPFMLHMAVQDDGLGIAEDEQEEIFGKFFRSGEIEIRNIPGTGLGLNITKSLIEKHGGTIWFESKHGQGTTFHFTIPFAELDEPDWGRYFSSVATERESVPVIH